MKREIELYKLKSNPNTIVRPIGDDYFEIFWTDQMQHNNLADSRWMVHSDKKRKNLSPLTDEEFIIVVNQYLHRFGSLPDEV